MESWEQVSAAAAAAAAEAAAAAAAAAAGGAVAGLAAGAIRTKIIRIRRRPLLPGPRQRFTTMLLPSSEHRARILAADGDDRNHKTTLVK